jgi:uncharacterized membrane protein
MLAWCLGLISVRVFRTGSPHFLFLIWNLFLACVPLAGSRALASLRRRSVPAWAEGALFALWVLFLPNAPYIVTDLVHVSPGAGVLFWYDLGLVLSCAAAGLLIGYLSVLDVHRLIENRFGHFAGWIVAGGALMLSGFGVYLGRVMRWNSWDVLIDPVGVFGSIADFLTNARLHLHAYEVMFLFGVGLLLGYAALHFLAVPDGNGRRRLWF